MIHDHDATEPPVTLLPAADLQKDADERAIDSDEAVEDDGAGTHLPASESGHMGEGGTSEPASPGLTPPPPD